ncbi:MAG: hypothetical protein KGL53_09360, partial [Elusimicrobia bacterium]|nr:hypothetical protein [Elusimicrobiota bacterium]
LRRCRLVQAVSDGFLPVSASSFSVTLQTDDPYDVEPPAASLAAGSATFPVSLRRAEPSPASAVISAVSSGSGGFSASTVTVQAAPFSKLEVLLPGETPQPGSASGRSGTTDFQIAGRAFQVTIRATDPFGNITTSATDTVAATSVDGATATLPGSASLAAGSTTLAGLVVQSTGLFTLSAADLSSASIPSARSSTFSVFALSVSSPSLTFSLPSGALIGTLEGSVNGRASDSVGVTQVDVALQDVASGLWFDWAGSFSKSSATQKPATVTPFRGTDVGWLIPFNDGDLVTGRKYFAVAVASNPTGLATVAGSTFTFDRGILVFAPKDGEGTATVAPASTAACEAVVATVTYTVGASGIGPGGAVALRIPSGWTAPAGLSTSQPPPPGYVTIVSTSLAWTVAGSSQVLFDPPAVGSVTLGSGWVSVGVREGAADSFLPGETLTFFYQGFPPAATTGSQPIDVRSQSAGTGTLVSLATAPTLGLTAGPARALAFSDADALALGPLQLSATMQVLATDGCGNQAAVSSDVLVGLAAGQAPPGGFDVDASASFFLAGAPSTSTAVLLASGTALSQAFTMKTATRGVDSEFLRASATLAGAGVQALRLISLRSSAVAPSAVSIDTGTLAAGATSVVLTPGTGARAVVRFTPGGAGLAWDVAVATESGFTSPLMRAAGTSASAGALTAAWDGVVCGAVCSYAPPGVYPVRVRTGGTAGAALEVRVATSPYLSGSLGTSGAGALVVVRGPGAGYGSAAQADSSGAFRVDGLAEGQAYAVRASTVESIQGLRVTLSTAAFSVLASTAGGA